MSFYIQKGLFFPPVVLAAAVTALLAAGCVKAASEPVLEPYVREELGTDEKREAASALESGQNPRMMSDGKETKGDDLSRQVGVETGSGLLPEKNTAAGQKDVGRDENTTGGEDGPQTVLTVHVCGAVKKEGVYSLPEGSRIKDAVEAAGGFSEDADREFLNLAMEVEDSWQIRVPFLRETEDSGAVSVPYEEGDAKKGSVSQRININTASVEELMKIPGIGESKAKRILEYRETNGKFESVEDIMNIKGIKENSFQKMKDFICT